MSCRLRPPCKTARLASDPRRALIFCSGGHSSSRGLECEKQRFLRDTGDERADQPTKTSGNIACEGGDFALHINAVVAFFHPPPGFHAPEIAAIVARRLFAFVTLARIFHFRDMQRRTAAMRASRSVARVVHVMFGVEH